MGMHFGLTLTADISTQVDISDLGIDEDAVTATLDMSSDVQLDDVTVEGQVDMTASARIENVEVSASDMVDYDAEAAFSENFFHWGVSIDNADFEVTDEPTGFSDVVAALGFDRDVAIKVYAALDGAGLSVN